MTRAARSRQEARSLHAALSIPTCALCLILVASGCRDIERLERGRQFWNETAAIASLRAIGVAQLTFSSACGGGAFAPALKILATPPKDGRGGPFVSSDLSVDPAVKAGYTISMSPGPPASELPESCNGLAAGHAVRSFFVSAVPAQQGGRFFATNADLKIYESTGPIPVTLSGPPPPPAAEVK